MSQQLSLADAAPFVDPWAEVRAQLPDQFLVRIINVEARVQAFIAIPHTTEVMTAGGDVYDGATVITPAPREGYTPAQRAAFIRTYDEAWQASHGRAT